MFCPCYDVASSVVNKKLSGENELDSHHCKTFGNLRDISMTLLTPEDRTYDVNDIHLSLCYILNLYCLSIPLGQVFIMFIYIFVLLSIWFVSVGRHMIHENCNTLLTTNLGTV